MKGRVTFKGGSGSGNYGHEGRPGKVGGSLAATTTMTLYHGTAEAFVNSIAKEGLTSSINYATDSKSTALHYALTAANKISPLPTTIAIVEVDKKGWKESGGSYNSKRVPPDSILAVHIFKPVVATFTPKFGSPRKRLTITDKDVAQPIETIQLKQAQDIMYIPVILD